jgi:hypothetical protein
MIRRNACAALAIVVALALAASASAWPEAAAASQPDGTVVLARPGPDVLLIWDATNDVAAIVAEGLSAPEGTERLERDAARVLAASLADVDRGATRIALRVTYRKTGAVSPVYGAATFAGVERFATFEMRAADASADRDGWRELAAAAPLPRWFTFRVTGSLPQP